MGRSEQHFCWQLKRKVRVDFRCRQPDTRPGFRPITKLRSNEQAKVSDRLGNQLALKPVSRRLVTRGRERCVPQLPGYLGSPPW
eukprot:4281759-Amphidinium_carterae.1